jgi:hypothetical protein
MNLRTEKQREIEATERKKELNLVHDVRVGLERKPSLARSRHVGTNEEEGEEVLRFLEFDERGKIGASNASKLTSVSKYTK